jgi:hypothetical protein
MKNDVVRVQRRGAYSWLTVPKRIAVKMADVDLLKVEFDGDRLIYHVVPV